MKVILTETIASLGTVGDEVNVAKGYARNYLVPKKKAIMATAKNRKLFERQRLGLEKQLAGEQTKAEALSEEIRGAVCTIAGKVSEEDRLYGSVAARDIAEQLKAQGFEVDSLNPLKLWDHISCPFICMLTSHQRSQSEWFPNRKPNERQRSMAAKGAASEY